MTTTDTAEKGYFDWLTHPLSDAWASVTGVGDNVANYINQKVTNAKDAITEGFSNMLGLGYDTLVSPINNFIRSIFDYIQGGIVSMMGNDSEFGKMLVDELQKIEDKIVGPDADAPVVAAPDTTLKMGPR
jgi:hypothetical protein